MAKTNIKNNVSSLPTALLALILAVPVMAIIFYASSPATDVWTHLKQTVLKDYVINSIILSLAVAIGTLIIGVSTAWLTTRYTLWGGRFLPLLLLLPMAMPAYIVAFTYTGMFDIAGPIQHYLRAYTGLSYGEYWFPEVRSMWGAITMLTLVLYPYVFLMARASFLEQSICVLDVGRTLGLSPWARFWRIGLPLSRPAIIAGVSLVVMETLADYGTMQFFGVSTFTTGIFKAWLGLNDLNSAANLASMLLMLIFAMVFVERYSRRRIRYQSTSQRHQVLRKTPLSFTSKMLYSIWCFLPFLLGFLVPFGQLLIWAIDNRSAIDSDFLKLCWNSIWLAGVTAFIATLCALFMWSQNRRLKTLLTRISVRIAAFGYAIPGTVIAIGVALPVIYLDSLINSTAQWLTGERIGAIFNRTLLALVFAYLVRFMTVSLNSVESGLSKIKPSIDEAAQSMNHGKFSILWHIHIPMLRSTLLTAGLIVFVDVLKELPATLLLRPFNFNTLAVKAFELAGDEQLFQASLPAVAIIITGLIPVIILNKGIAHKEQAR